MIYFMFFFPLRLLIWNQICVEVFSESATLDVFFVMQINEQKIMVNCCSFFVKIHKFFNFDLTAKCFGYLFELAHVLRFEQNKGCTIIAHRFAEPSLTFECLSGDEEAHSDRTTCFKLPKVSMAQSE